jgi:hypothetical protein
LEIKLSLDINIVIDKPRLKYILKAFVKIINPVFQQVVEKVLDHFANQYLDSGKLGKMLRCKYVTRKSFTGKRKTNIITPFGKIELPQLQVQMDGRRKTNITRLLLGIEKWVRIPKITVKYLGLMGALAPLRVVNKFMELFTGQRVSLMAIVRSMRALAKKIQLGVKKKETNEFEADGTGIPINGSGKRGKELKVLVQRKKNGRIRIAGMVIGSYKQGWKKLFKPLKKALRRFKEIILLTDGDTSPLKGLKGIKVIIQRCLFHIGHEMKYTLWKDKVTRKSALWNAVMAKTLDVTSLRRIRENPEVCEEVITVKKKLLDELIEFCKTNTLKNSTAFLENARFDVFTGIEKRIAGGTTSLIERVMRTVNQRINVAKWSTASALSVAVIRGAYYYNGFNV